LRFCIFYDVRDMFEILRKIFDIVPELLMLLA
jgi:hypothetical protein